MFGMFIGLQKGPKHKLLGGISLPHCFVYKRAYGIFQPSGFCLGTFYFLGPYTNVLLLKVLIPEGPYTLPMELGPNKNHPHYGFGDLVP